MFSNVKTLQNLKSDISLNGFLPSETTQVWVPELVFENTVRPHIVHDMSHSQMLGKFEYGLSSKI